MAVTEAARYEGICVGDNYVMKDHGSYIQVNIDANSGKWHISFDVYYDSNGRITRIKKHR